MHPGGLAILILCAVALLTLPRRWAPVALLIGCCYLTVAQRIDVAGINFPFYRILLLIGLGRVLLRGERLAGSFNRGDKLLLAWACWVIFASFFHIRDAGSGPIYATGFVMDVSLVYFLIRVWCRNLGETRSLIAMAAAILLPVALEMVGEKLTGYNWFSIFGGVSSEPLIRDGKLRANGPFLHAILAGTVGANAFPLFVGLFNTHRLMAVLGGFASIAMVLACASSGPIMSLAAGVAAIAAWKFRRHTGKMRLAAVLAYFAAGIAMGQPGYYILSRIDLTGSSTGYHRARLIESSIEHLSEWWLFGTDYTRHWMPTGVSFSSNHTDITNYLLVIGILGGVPAILFVVAILWHGFASIGRAVKALENQDPRDQFLTWCIGAALLAHTSTSISVAYFDQSMIFFWLTVALASSQHRPAGPARPDAPRRKSAVCSPDAARPGQETPRIRPSRPIPRPL